MWSFFAICDIRIKIQPLVGLMWFEAIAPGRALPAGFFAVERERRGKKCRQREFYCAYFATVCAKGNAETV